jgi:hypothetical protein
MSLGMRQVQALSERPQGAVGPTDVEIVNLRCGGKGSKLNCEVMRRVTFIRCQHGGSREGNSPSIWSELATEQCIWCELASTTTRKSRSSAEKCCESLPLSLAHRVPCHCVAQTIASVTSADLYSRGSNCTPEGPMRVRFPPPAPTFCALFQVLLPGTLPHYQVLPKPAVRTSPRQ